MPIETYSISLICHFLGTHANYLETVKQLEDKKAQRIWLAEQWRAYQLQCINIASESEKKQADDEYQVTLIFQFFGVHLTQVFKQNEKRDCKERLMKTTLLKRQQLEEEKNAISLVGTCLKTIENLVINVATHRSWSSCVN